MNPVDQLIQQGLFQEAVRALEEAPSTRSMPARLPILFNLRTRLQEYDAALAALEELVRLEPKRADFAAALRDCAQAERALTARRTDPDVAGRRASLKLPQPFSRAYLQAAILHAQGQHAQAATLLTRAALDAPAVAGTLVRTNGQQVRFENLTDSDDLTGPHLLCFVNGSVLDVPYHELRSVRFAPPRSSMDFTWMPALLETREGEQFVARIPAYYTGTGRHGAAPVRMGDMTVWEHDHGYAEGAGQRDFKLSVGDGSSVALVGLHQVAQLVFE